MFLRFVNFNQYIIKDFSKIIVLLTLLLKEIGSLNSTPKAFKFDDNKAVSVSSRANQTIVNSSKNNKSKNLMRLPNIGALKKSIFLTLNIKKDFNNL